MTTVFNALKRKHTIDIVEALAGHRAGRLVLVDVRENSERARGFAPGSRYLPLGELKLRLGELPTDRPVAFICESGVARQWLPPLRGAPARTPTTSPAA